MFENYYAPIMHVLNIRQTPWIGLCGDPKYVPSMARDILNEPKVVMSQTYQILKHFSQTLRRLH